MAQEETISGLPIQLSLDENGLSENLITVAQYCVFLNEAAKYGAPHNLCPPLNGNDQEICRSSNPPYTYAPLVGKKKRNFNNITGKTSFTEIEIADYPITNISLISAARFCNWMHHKSQSTIEIDLQKITETEAYQITELSSRCVDNFITPSSEARWRLPHYLEVDQSKLDFDTDLGLYELTDTEDSRKSAQGYYLSRQYYLAKPINSQFYSEAAPLRSPKIGFRLVKNNN